MKKLLKYLYIYLTDQCNLKCIHCWQSAPLKGEVRYSELIFGDCKDFLGDAINLGLKSVVFSGGEPLLNKEFKKFANYFYDNSILMTLETNGILLSKNHIFNVVKNYKIYCAISLDGINPKTHNKQRGGINSFIKTVKSINKLEESKIPYQLIMAISKLNYLELLPLLEWINENCKYCNKFKINVINPLGRGKKLSEEGILFQPDELPQLSDEVALLFRKYPFITLHIDPAFISFKNLMLKYSCGGHCGYSSSLSILSNGNISVCSLGKQVEKYIFGHVTNIDIKQEWENNPILLDIHENMHKRLKGVCSNCIFRKRCLGGCRAEALYVYGDFFAPHPRCQSYYKLGKFPKSRLRESKFHMDFF
jgi:SynChlorMet cassette radical SAM/SPASM protein ScmF